MNQLHLPSLFYSIRQLKWSHATSSLVFLKSYIITNSWSQIKFIQGSMSSVWVVHLQDVLSKYIVPYFLMNFTIYQVGLLICEQIEESWEVFAIVHPITDKDTIAHSLCLDDTTRDQSLDSLCDLLTGLPTSLTGLPTLRCSTCNRITNTSLGSIQPSTAVNAQRLFTHIFWSPSIGWYWFIQLIELGRRVENKIGVYLKGW